MKLSETRLDQAGLLRCCTSGLESMNDDDEVHEGQHVPCKHHGSVDDPSGVILVGKVWTPAWVVKKGKA